MKRRTCKRDPNHESDDDGSISDDSKRLRRRRRQMGNGDAVNVKLSELNATDVSVTTTGKSQGAPNSSHSIANIGENVYLPDYVREHNSTLTFPEKVRSVAAIVLPVTSIRFFRSSHFTLLES